MSKKVEKYGIREFVEHGDDVDAALVIMCDRIVGRAKSAGYVPIDDPLTCNIWQEEYGQTEVRVTLLVVKA